MFLYPVLTIDTTVETFSNFLSYFLFDPVNNLFLKLEICRSINAWLLHLLSWLLKDNSENNMVFSRVLSKKKIYLKKCYNFILKDFFNGPFSSELSPAPCKTHIISFKVKTFRLNIMIFLQVLFENKCDLFSITS